MWRRWNESESKRCKLMHVLCLLVTFYPLWSRKMYRYLTRSINLVHASLKHGQILSNPYRDADPVRRQEMHKIECTGYHQSTPAIMTSSCHTWNKCMFPTRDLRRLAVRGRFMWVFPSWDCWLYRWLASPLQWHFPPFGLMSNTNV